MMYWDGGGWPFWQVVLMWVLMIGFWGLLVWAVYAVVTSFTRRPDRRAPGGSPREILDSRLARGDIDSDEYRRLRDLLAARPNEPPADPGTGS